MSHAPQPSLSEASLERYALDAMILARCRRPLGHEMKNSVQGLYSGIEILNKAIDGAGKSRIAPADCLPLLRRQLDGLQEALHRILDDVAPQPAGPSDIDLVELVRDVARFLMSDAAVAGVRLELDLPQRAIAVATLAIVRRVLLGFFLDAIDAMRNTGGALRVKVSAAGAGVAIELRDSRTGAASTAAAADYVRIDAALLRRIAARLMQAEGGTCSIESNAADGCAVHITLPANDAVADSSRSAPRS
jgi:signal transduction histidine kinase